VELEILSEFDGLRDSYRDYFVSTRYPTVFNGSTILLHSLNRIPMIDAAATAWFAAQSPDRLDLLASADSRVFRYQSHALG